MINESEDFHDMDHDIVSDFEEDSGSEDSNQQRESSKWKYDSRTGERLPNDAEVNEFTIGARERMFRHPVNVLTGKRVAWGTPLGGNIKTYQYFIANRPCDKLTGKKLALGTELSEFVVSYSYIRNKWPYNARTAKKMPDYETPYSEDVISYCNLLKRWPYRKSTGEKLKWSQRGEIGVVEYGKLEMSWPHDSETGKKLEFGTPIKGKVVTYRRLMSRWPYSVKTGKKLPLGTKVDNTDVVRYFTIQSMWPYNADTGEKVPYGTPYSDTIISYEAFYNNYVREVVGTREKIRGRLALEKAIAEGKKLYLHPRQRNKLVFYNKETVEHRRGSPPLPFSHVFEEDELVSRGHLVAKMKKEGDKSLVYGNGPEKGRRAPERAKLGDILMINGEKVTIVTAHEEFITRIREESYRHYWETGDLSQVMSCEEKASSHSEGVVFTPAAQALLKEEKSESRKVSATERFIQEDDAETPIKKSKSCIMRI